LKALAAAILLLAAMLAPAAFVSSPALAQAGPTVTDGGVDAAFPDSLVFRASAQSDSTIEKVRLRYTILPDGTAAVAEAKFQPGKSISASYALQSRDQTSLYLPPGTTINYYWEVTDADGLTARTEQATFFYTDGRFDWTSLEAGGVTVYFYSGSEDDARKMLSVASDAIATMSQLLAATIDFPVKVWAYDSVDDMRPALQPRSETYDQATITAGVRVASDTVLVLGNVSFDTLRHELTHVVTAAAGEGPLGTLPAWLDEGTAVYAENDPAGFADAIDRAIDRGNVLSVRSITSSPGDPNKVALFYGEAWSLVSYLNDTYGPQKFAQLFAEIQNGKRIDAALTAVYGFDQDGLEDEWRASHDLPPRATPEPEQKPEATEPASSGQAPQAAKDDGGTSVGTVIAIAAGTIALAGVIGFAGITLARKLR